MHESLLIIPALPFLLVLPGWFLTSIFFLNSDRIEKSTLSVCLSMVVVYASLFAVEKTVGKLTPSNTFTAVATVNIATFLLFLATKFWQRTHRK